MSYQHIILKSLLIVIISITSYYVLISGYNAFISYSRSREGFASDKCSEHEMAAFRTQCLYDLKGSAAIKPISPQLAKFTRRSRAGARASPNGPITASEANTALLQLLGHVNQRRYDPAMFRFRNMIKCLFFTCSSPVKAIEDMTPLLDKRPLIFTGARGLAQTQGQPPASLLTTVLSYLDTRRQPEDEPAFFETIRDIFMDKQGSVLRTDIEFGHLLDKVDPQHIFQ